MRFLPSVSLTFITRITSSFLSAVSAIIVARYLGPEGKGILAILVILMGIFIQIGNLGLHASTVYFVGKRPRESRNIAGIAFWTCVVLGGLAIIITLSSGEKPSFLLKEVPIKFLWIFIISAPFQLFILVYSNFLLGIGKILDFNLLEFLPRVLTLILLILIVVYLGKGIHELIAGWTALYILIGIGALIYYSFLKIQGFSFHLDLFRDMLRYGIKSYIACLLFYFINRFDQILVNYFVGIAQAGIYSVAVQCAEFLLILPVSIGAILFQRVSSSREDKGELTAKVSRHTIFVLLIICMLTAVFSHYIIKILFGARFLPSVIPFLILIPGIFFLSLESIYMNDLAGRGLPPVTYITPAIGLIINIALNLILIPRVGVAGASIAASITYFIMFSISAAYLCRVINKRFSDLFLPNPKEFGDIAQQLISFFRIQNTKY